MYCVAQQMPMFTVQKLNMLDFTDPSIVLRSTEQSHIPDEEQMSLKRTKHVLCDAARNRPLISLSQIRYNNCIVFFNRSMHTFCVHHVHTLMTYYKATWLNGDFPPAMWNVHAATTRTNSSVEGWHSRLNKAIGCCHLNIYKLVTVLPRPGRTTLWRDGTAG